MRLSMYRVDDGPARAGLSDADDRVYDLAAALDAAGAARLPEGVDVLGLVAGWPQWRGDVLGAIERVAQGGGPAPVAGAALIVPFPSPRRGAFAIGGNYAKHVEATAKTTGLALGARKSPVFFVKPTASFNGPHGVIEYDPGFTTRVDYEVELGVVIGTGGRDIAEERALDHVFGFMVVNDVSARDLMLRNKPQIDYLRGKGLDTFFPMGPGVTPRELVADHRGLQLRLAVNGEVRQDATTDEMVRDVPEIIAELSRSLTLYPGDIIATGTPGGVAQEMEDPRFLVDGDVVEAEVATLGRLVNRVRTR